MFEWPAIRKFGGPEKRIADRSEKWNEEGALEETDVEYNQCCHPVQRYAGTPCNGMLPLTATMLPPSV